MAPSGPLHRVVRPRGGLRRREPAPRRDANARAGRDAQPDRDPCEQRRHARVAECPAHRRKLSSSTDFLNSAAVAHPRLLFLGDIFPVPPPFRLRTSTASVTSASRSASRSRYTVSPDHGSCHAGVERRPRIPLGDPTPSSPCRDGTVTGEAVEAEILPPEFGRREDHCRPMAERPSAAATSPSWRRDLLDKVMSSACSVPSNGKVWS